MKFFFFCFLALSLLSTRLFAQVAPNLNNSYQPKNFYKKYSTDSASFTFDRNYYLVDDTCAQIIRYCHFDFNQKKFTGKFSDVKSDNLSQILAEGTYNGQGKRNGKFTVFYWNGNVMASGEFVDNVVAGNWMLYYESGKPKIEFEIIDNAYRIINAWNEKNVKIVKDGHGNYNIPYLVGFIWSGKIKNGRPDGTWNLNDIHSQDDPAINSEEFVDGKFYSGQNKLGSYSDSSHIVLVRAELPSVTNAERLIFSYNSCKNSYPNHQVTIAAYAKGSKELEILIHELMHEYLRKIKVGSGYSATVVEGQIDENGKLVNLKEDGLENTPFIRFLKGNFPKLQPATIDNQPVKEKIRFNLNFGNNLFRYSYHFLDVVQ